VCDNLTLIIFPEIAREDKLTIWSSSAKFVWNLSYFDDQISFHSKRQGNFDQELN
jgi:hypothetical protein